MKIILISDTHGKTDNIYILKPGDDISTQETLNNITNDIYLPEEADTIIHSGDISMIGTEYEIEKFLVWYSSLPYKNKIFISGNHDKLFDFHKEIAKEIIAKYPNIIYLESSEITIDGIKIYGEPRQPTFGFNWAFNVERGERIKRYWDVIPDDVCILVTHGPPYDTLDLTYSGMFVGCVDLSNRIKEIKPLCVVYGHIHESYGYEFKDGTHFFNASLLNQRYQLCNKPRIIEIDENKNLKIIQ